jgi:hypothetical protein
VKKIRKKCASISSKVGSKENHGNTDQKVGLRQDDVLNLKWSNSSKRYYYYYFSTSFLRKYLEKNPKNAKISKKKFGCFGW